MFGFIIAGFLSILGGAVVGSLILALFLQLATKVVTKETPNYGAAYGSMFASSMVCGVISLALDVAIVPMLSHVHEIVFDIVMYTYAFVSFLITSWLVGVFLEIGFLYGLRAVIVEVLLVLLAIGIPAAILISTA